VEPALIGKYHIPSGNLPRAKRILPYNRSSMIKYYFIIFWRNFAKNKSYFLLNLLGLTLGMTCFLFALLFVFYETNYDSYVLYKDRIARMVTTINSSGNVTNTALSVGNLTPAMRKQFPEISNMVRFLPVPGRTGINVKDKGNTIPLENIYYVDPDVFSVFSYPLIEGDRKSCLSAPGTIVLSKKIAKRLFGNTSPLERSVVLNNKLLKVTGIIQDLPGNSDLVFDGLISWKTLAKSDDDSWVYTYILFNSAMARNSFQLKLDKFTDEMINPELERNEHVTLKNKLEPMGSIHFSNNSVYDTPKGDKKFVNIFLVTGILILLIACTNSVNMMVVRSFSRATESTIQKIYGASRTALILQQMLESILIGLVAAILSFFIIWILLPEYAVVINRRLDTPDLFNGKILGAIIAALLVLGLSGAIYTGFFLRRVQLADILRSGTTRGYQMKWVPRLMLGFQFFISMGMMVAALVVHRQVKYMKEAPLGFNPNNVVVIELPKGEEAAAGSIYLKNALSTVPGIQKLSLCGDHTLPGQMSDLDNFVYIENGIQIKKVVADASVDPDYVDVLQVHLSKGERFHTPKKGKSKNEVMVNELFAKRAGWKGYEVIGQKIAMAGDSSAYQVVGVVSDFHFSSLHNPVVPMIIIQDPGDPAYLLVRTDAAATNAVLDRIGKEWKKTYPGLPFFSYFLDQHILQQYRSDDDLLALLLILTSLIIVISCIGLMAYTSFIMRIASTNIAIRRIIGASFRNIFNLFNRQFVIILAIAFLIATPVSWYLLKNWLNNFSYHIQPAVTDFLVPVLTIGAVVGSVVAWYSWRCIRINPAKIIREK
jgi:putative ABC transport system permease protein